MLGETAAEEREALRSQLRDLLDADWDNGYASLWRAHKLRRVAKELAAAHRADWPGPWKGRGVMLAWAARYNLSGSDSTYREGINFDGRAGQSGNVRGNGNGESDSRGRHLPPRGSLRDSGYRLEGAGARARRARSAAIGPGLSAAIPLEGAAI